MTRYYCCYASCFFIARRKPREICVLMICEVHGLAAVLSQYRAYVCKVVECFLSL